MQFNNAQEKLAATAEICAVVLGRGGDYVLVRIDGDAPVDTALTATAAAKGFAYCGTLGIVDGKPAAECEPNMDAAFTCTMAAFEFARMAAPQIRMTAVAEDDFRQFAESLWSLTDPRPEA